MIPTDMLPQRAANAPLKGASQKSEKKPGGREEVSFAHAMKKIADDKEQANQPVGTDKQGKIAAIARWHRLEVRAVDAADEGRTNEDADEATSEEGGTEAGLGAALDVPVPAAAAPNAANNVLALLRLHPHADVKRAGGGDEAVGTGRVDATPGLPDGATVQAAGTVEILDIKVETHLARSGTELAAIPSAEALGRLGGLRAGETRKSDAAAAPATAAARDKQAVPKGGEGRIDLPPAAGAADGAMPPVDAAGQSGGNASGRNERNDAASLRPLPEPATVHEPAPVEDRSGQASAPTAPLVQQIGPQLADTVREMKAAAEAVRTSAGTAADTSTAGPVRVLSIDLHPAELGSVSVRMSMHGEVLGVQIEAERPETARMLQSDASALSDMLRTAGVQVDGITVRAANMDTVSAGAGSSQSFMQQSDSQSGGAQPDARASGGNGQGRDAQSFGGSRRDDRGQPGQDHPQRGTGSGLYI